MNPLQLRLAALRRRLRWVIAVRGGCWALGFLVLALALAGWIDWRLNAPSLARALFLAAALVGAGYLAVRHIMLPLRTRRDDLGLALRIERHYPELNDCLASTVQFLEQSEPSDWTGSPLLRERVVRSALARVQSYDFGPVIDRRGLRGAGLLFIAAAFVAGTLGAQYPALVGTALARLINPFGVRAWPPKTQLALDNVQRRVARGEPFEIRSLIRGVIPAWAEIECEGLGPAHQTSAPTQDKDGQAVVAVRWNQVERDFRFRVRANDADTGWNEVAVMVPPQLALLNGRPTPQARLNYPTYTDLPSQDLPDGAGSIEAVAGTQLTLRAAADKPLARAWIEQPEQASTRIVAWLGSLGQAAPAAVLALAPLGTSSEEWNRIPADLDPDYTTLSVTFTPRITGTYALVIEDGDGLTGVRRFEARVLTDPPPAVTLERPSSSQDSLAILPNAAVMLQVLAEDPVFAVRSASLELRCRDRNNQPKKLAGESLPLYEPARLAAATSSLLSALAARPVPFSAIDLRLRPRRVQVARTWPLSDLHLEEGDVLTIHAVADDFDDITAGKAPGRSHEIELRVVGPTTLDTLLSQDQARVQQELLRLQKQQDEAIRKVAPAETQWRHTGKLRSEDVDQLLQAEAQQQGIQARIGTPEEGLRAEVEKILQTLKANGLPRSSTQERMELVGRELGRLAREELDQIEPRLANARKENENAKAPPAPRRAAPSEKGLLGEARAHQEEVAATLQDLLKQLEPWSSTREIRGEAKTLLDEQRKLNQATNDLAKEILRGVEPSDLHPEQKAELDRTAGQQGKLAERLAELINKMDRVSGDKESQARNKKLQAQQQLKAARGQQNRTGDQSKAIEEVMRALDESDKGVGRRDKDKLQQARDKLRKLREQTAPATQTGKALAEAAETLEDAAAIEELASPLQEAARQGHETAPDVQMKSARTKIEANQLGAAVKEQQASLQNLQKIVKALEERREEELDRLVKKQREAESRLGELARDQDSLRKKIKEAQGIKDPRARADALKRLAREQEQLRERAQEMAQQLTRMRAEQAGQELSQAGAQMEQAAQQLDRGEPSDETQEETLDRLADARQELKESKQDAQEELQREQLAKTAEQIKQLLERQEGLVVEAQRIQKSVLQQKEWKRALLASIGATATAQRDLGEETARLHEKLDGAEVFVHLLDKAAKSMEQAAAALLKLRAQGLKDFRSTAMDETPFELQQEARKRLVQLVEALKQGGGQAKRPAEDGEQAGGEGDAGGQTARGGDGIPHIAQLKLLRTLQKEINERTEAFAKEHTDPKKLPGAAERALKALGQEQQEIADLLDKLTGPEAGEGEKK